jgi:hypothetical protein
MEATRGRFAQAIGYEYEEDGKLHTRFSDLLRCTPASAPRVAREYMGLLSKYSGGGVLDFGKVRHDMFAEESRNTGRTASCFRSELGVECTAEYVEEAFRAELHGVIIHSRPDIVSVTDAKVLDYKTIQGDPKQFGKSMQLLIYAWVLFKNGIRVREAVWLCERWNPERSEIMGYGLHRSPITLSDLATAERWLAGRVFTLKHALKILEHS